MDSVLGNFLLRNDDIYSNLNEFLSHSLPAPGTIHEPASLVYPTVAIVIRIRVHALFRSYYVSVHVPVRTLAFYYMAHRSATRRQRKPHKNRRRALN